jgi:hypothetical protein
VRTDDFQEVSCNLVLPDDARRDCGNGRQVAVALIVPRPKDPARTLVERMNCFGELVCSDLARTPSPKFVLEFA